MQNNMIVVPTFHTVSRSRGKGIPMMPYLVGGLVCAAVTLVSPWILRPVLVRAGILDVPNARSSHSTPVLRGGGIATTLGMLAGSLFVSSGPLWLAMGAGAAAAILGFSDDLRGLSVRVRLSVQLLIGLALGLAVTAVFGMSALVIPLVALLFAGYVNVANFMDGIDGMSSLHGAVAGAAFALAGIVSEKEWLIAAGVILGVAFLAFLPWNIVGSRFFLGDSGSYLLGGFIVATVVAGLAAGVAWPIMLAPLAIYLSDASLTLLRRVLRRERLWEAHRAHLYQQLAHSGLPHLLVAAWVAGFTVLAVAAGFITLSPIPGAEWIAFAAIVMVCALYLGLSALIVMRKTAGTA